jgi:ABC-type glycerol-3-phosphate transport system substrate-binding protein
MQKINGTAAVLAALALALGLSACGEQKVTAYQPGKYSGAPVAVPWDSPQYGGKQADWEAALQARTQAQNDYARMR